ncbi:SNF2 family N-terminal domain-containing protein [Chytriomyces cf. hyalinus JEL632]|nr:SNF2 family N-terminal domain-containing protein [Chytriomyces cf. hyalinus JEL632]
MLQKEQRNSGAVALSQTMPDEEAHEQVQEQSNKRVCLPRDDHGQVNQEVQQEVQQETIVENPRPAVSLAALFSEIPSPSTNIPAEICDLLNNAQSRIRTPLFRYQCHSIAKMISIELDPPDWSFLGVGDNKHAASPSGRGGILCENMGTGKTLIVIGLIVATLDMPCSRTTGPWTVSLTSHAQSVPELDRVYKWELAPSAHLVPLFRDRVPSLFDLTVLNLKLNCNGLHLAEILDQMPPHASKTYDSIRQYYTILETQEHFQSIYNQRREKRSNARSEFRESDQIHLSQITLIAVPDTLIAQWITEFNKHVPSSSNISRLDLMSKEDAIPAVEVLLTYHVILISHSRLARESESGKLNFFGGIKRVCTCPYKKATRERDCHCAVEVSIPASPLMQIHFKRLVFDEGHLLKHESRLPDSKLLEAVSKLRSDCKWVCSGTPLPNVLVGEVKNETRRMKMEKADLKKLEGVVVNYLGLAPFRDDKPLLNALVIRPWMGSNADRVRRVRSLFQTLMVRHQPNDIIDENPLPPLYERRVLLKMNQNERININVIISLIKLNSILSEREGADYFSHPSQTKSLKRVVANLKLCLFNFNGTDIIEEAQNALQMAQQGLEKAMSGKKSYNIDHLKEIMHHLQNAQNSNYAMLQRMAEHVMYTVKPAVCACVWAFADVGIMVDLEHRLLTNVEIEVCRKQLKLARINAELDGANEIVMEEAAVYGESVDSGYVAASGGPSSMAAATSVSNPRIRGVQFTDEVKPADNGVSMGSAETAEASGSNIPEETEKPELCDSCAMNPAPSLAGSIVSTISTKLNYIASQILQHQAKEKIIVYTTHDNEMAAVWEFCKVAKIQCLLFQKTHQRISEKAKNVTTFNTSDVVRVIIMDVTRASYGLDLSSASRIYFMRPIHDNAMYNQAIKRAHRLGCVQPVHVEVIAFEGTLEDQEQGDGLLEGRDAGGDKEKQQQQQVQRDRVEDLKMKDLIDVAPFVKAREERGEVECSFSVSL